MTKISIITVNLNNKSGLEKTIESVVNQAYYPYIEYLIIDGNSTDGSIDVIKQYSDKITYWISEKDQGVYDAMNKGIKQSTGDYLLFLNSGDTLANSTVIEKLIQSGDNKDIIYGNVNYIFDTFTQKSDYPQTLTFDYFIFNTLPHPATLIKKEVLEKTGLYDISLPISADWKLFLTAIFKYNCSYKLVDIIVSDFYMNGMSCTQQAKLTVEDEKKRIFETEFTEYLNVINAYRKMRFTESSRLMNFVKKLGFFKYL